MSVADIFRPKLFEVIACEKGDPRSVDYYMHLPYRVEVIQDIGDGSYVFGCPELPGCVTRVGVAEDGFALLNEVKRVWFLKRIEAGEDIPMPEPTVKDSYNALPERIRKECDESLKRKVLDAHSEFVRRAKLAGVKDKCLDDCEDAFLLTFEGSYREGWSAGYMQLRHDLKARARETAIELRGLTLDELLIKATGLTLQEIIALSKGGDKP